MLAASVAAPGVAVDGVFWVSLFVIVLAPTAVVSIDRSRGDAWEPESRTARLAARVLRLYSRATLLPLHGPTTRTLATNVRRSALTLLGTIAGIALLGVFIVNVLAPRNALAGGAAARSSRTTAARSR